MHNKLMLADGALALYGGRNVADEYFMGNQEANFIDLDVLSAGAVVPALAAVFDRYWNSEAAWPVQALLPQTADAAAAQARFQAAVADAAPVLPAYARDPLGQTAVEVQLQAGRLALVPATARVFADPPEKALQDHIGGAPTAAMAGLLGVIGSARQEVLIVSPYFVPGTVGMPMMAAAARSGVCARGCSPIHWPPPTSRWCTTTTACTRPAMLRLGVQILELSPEAVQRSRSFGAFGRSTPRLHAKVALVDNRHLLVGSVNLDARSAIGNTELGVAIDSPVLAGQFIRLMTGEREGGAYRVVLQDDGQTLAWQWLDCAGAGAPARRTSRAGSAWLRLKLWLQALVVDERLL